MEPLGLLSAPATGMAKYQDTGNVGSAMVTAVGAFAVNVIPLVKLGKTIDLAFKAVPKAVVVISAQSVTSFASDATVGFLDGKSAGSTLKTALIDAGVTLVTGGIGSRLDNKTLPVKVTLEGGLAVIQQQAVSVIEDGSPDASAVANPLLGVANCPHLPISTRLPEDDITYISNHVLRKGR